MKKLLISSLIICLTYISNFAQSPFEAGLFLGGTVYNGDIDVTLQNFLPQTRPAFGVFGRYNYNSSLSARLQFFRGQVFGDEKNHPSSSYRQMRGFSFTSPLTEVSAQLEWNAIKLDKSLHFDRENPFLTLYGFGGLGGAFFNPKTNFNEPNPFYDDLSADKNATYAKNSLVLLGGGGIKMHLNERWTIGGEVGLRKTFTDYLDGISKLAGPRAKDYYYFVGLTASYAFGGDSGLVGNSSRWNRGGNKTMGCPGFK